jgi:hypothetical protein
MVDTFQAAEAEALARPQAELGRGSQPLVERGQHRHAVIARLRSRRRRSGGRRGLRG